jgi:rubredoxin
MSHSIRVDKGSLERYHTVSCADCGQQKDIEEEERADAISALYAAEWRQLPDGWTCPTCLNNPAEGR